MNQANESAADHDLEAVEAVSIDRGGYLVEVLAKLWQVSKRSAVLTDMPMYIIAAAMMIQYPVSSPVSVGVFVTKRMAWLISKGWANRNKITNIRGTIGVKNGDSKQLSSTRGSVAPFSGLSIAGNQSCGRLGAENVSSSQTHLVHPKPSVSPASRPSTTYSRREGGSHLQKVSLCSPSKSRNSPRETPSSPGSL